VNYLLALGRMFQERDKNDDLKTSEQYYKAAVAINDKNVNAHFYLGLLYEKEKNKDGAKSEYQKVIDLLSAAKGNDDTVAKLKKMIANVDAGVANTAESLGLTQPAAASNTPPAATSNAPAGTTPATTTSTAPAASAPAATTAPADQNQTNQAAPTTGTTTGQ